MVLQSLRNMIKIGKNLKEPTGDLYKLSEIIAGVYSKINENRDYAFYALSGGLALWAGHTFLNRDVEETTYRKAYRIGKSLVLYTASVVSLLCGLDSRKTPTE